MKIPIQKIDFSPNIALHILRLDQIHDHISGNKWFKLKYNLEEAKHQRKNTILTFGGAYSNHIAATAAAGKEHNFKTIGVIRGEEHLPLNPTLEFAKEQGMIFYYMDRTTYREKKSEVVINELKNKFDDFYLIPEGGTNEFAIKGTEEIVDLISIDYDYITCPIGTGGTIAGLINTCPQNAKILGFPALKGDFMKDEVSNLLKEKKDNYSLISEYHFGGYAKFKPELIEFITDFKKQYSIQLDPIYTGKMMYGVFDLIKNNYFEKGKKIVAIHTGGLQGVEGFNKRFQK